MKSPIKNMAYWKAKNTPAKASGIGALVTGAKGGFTPDIDRDDKEEKSPNNLKLDLTKKARDKVAMMATGGIIGDESKGTDRDSLMGKK